MKRKWVVLVAVAVGLSVVPSVCFPASFVEAPPTQALYRPTAYTLRAGEWEVGIPFILAPLVVSVGYGLTESFELRTMPLSFLYGQFGLSGKLALPLGTGFDMALPVGATVQFDPLAFLWSAGAVFSLDAGSQLTLHGGVSGGMAQTLYVLPYAIVDYDVLPNLKLVTEVGLYPLSGVAGVLLRLLDFLELRVGVGFPMWFYAGLAARF